MEVLLIRVQKCAYFIQAYKIVYYLCTNNICMKKIITQYFSFSQRERNALILLCTALALLLAFPWVLPYLPRKIFATDFTVFDAQVAHYKETLQLRQDAEEEQRNQRRKWYRKRTAFGENGYDDQEGEKYNWRKNKGNYEKKRPSKGDIEQEEPLVLTPFDPNDMTFERAKALGLASKTAHIWVNYLEKGGKFRRKSDLKKIYGLSDADFERIAPYASLPEGAMLAKNQMKTGKDFGEDSLGGEEFGSKPDFYADNHEYRDAWKADDGNNLVNEEIAQKARRPDFYAQRDPKMPTIDINLADSSEWMQLRGIGAKRAGSIVRFRKKLGGFSSIDQVAETRSLPDSVFAVIKPFLLNGHTELIKKVNVNTATAKELSMHPYVSFQQANVIVNYREQHGKYAAIADIKKTSLVSDAEYEKLAPYLTTE